MKTINSRGVKHQRYYLLNEDQAVFLLALSRNTDQVVELKLDLTIAFKKSREQHPIKTAMPAYSIRAKLNSRNIPDTCWGAVVELEQWLSMTLYHVGYELAEAMLPDGSYGRTFCAHLRTLDYDTDSIGTYPHEFPDGRCVQAKAYPNDTLGQGKDFFYQDWLPRYAPKYFKKKGDDALEYFQKAFPMVKLPASQKLLF